MSREDCPVWLVLYMDGTVDMRMSQGIPRAEKPSWQRTQDDIRALPEATS